MIYVIKSSAIINNETDELGLILKIGYTKDDGKKSRFDCYITENPTIKILYLIPNGDEQDEKNLHYYFRDYLKYGNEWFNYDDKILEFFKNHTTKESLKELDTYISKHKQQIIKREQKLRESENTLKYVNRVIYNKGFNRDLLKELLDIIQNNDQDFIDSYFTTIYPDIDFDRPREYDNEIANIIENIDNLDKFWLKMRYIYSLNMSEDLAKRVFDNLLDTNFSKYYYSISKEVASKLGYSKKAMDKEYDRLNSISSTINLDNLDTEIYSNFTIGSRYSKSYIKEKLKELYDKLGYSKTAKANDIEEYFEVRSCQVTNKVTKKLEHSFELIRKIK